MADGKIDRGRVKRILNRVFMDNPLAHEAVIYRFGLEGEECERKLDRERAYEEVALLLGLGDGEQAETVLDDALRKLRG